VSRHDESNLHWERWPGAGTSDEHHRLQLIERAYDAFTIAHLESTGVAEGWRCLEIGAGVGSTAAWMAQRAGAGNVVATELRPELLSRAEQAGVRVVRHDVTVDPPLGAAFDLIHARAVMEHLTAREEVIGRLASWLAPGGWLVIEDFTFMPPIAARPLLRRMEEALIEMLASNVGTDLSWARSLPLPLERAGLTDTSAEVFGLVLRGGSPVAAVLEATMRAAEPALVAGGWITSDEMAQLGDLCADPTLVDCSIVMVAGRGRRPVSV
jgi:2-polyprenyl-3-methyl-5-hydroxy-6-metoxy-1,4-benzoquinol methylase